MGVYLLRLIFIKLQCTMVFATGVEIEKTTPCSVCLPLNCLRLYTEQLIHTLRKTKQCCELFSRVSFILIFEKYTIARNVKKCK